MMQIQMLSEEAEKIEQHVQMLDQQANELQEIRKSIEGIKNTSGNQEILANLGKGIFVKAEVKSKELLINIGKETIVKKTPEETIGIIDNQLLRLTEGKQELISRIQEIQQQVQGLLIQARKSDSKSNHEHDECECEDCEGECDCNGDCKCEENECECGHKH